MGRERRQTVIPIEAYRRLNGCGVEKITRSQTSMPLVHLKSNKSIEDGPLGSRKRKGASALFNQYGLKLNVWKLYSSICAEYSDSYVLYLITNAFR